MNFSFLLICFCCLFVLNGELFGQTTRPALQNIPFLDAESQTNIVIFVNALRSNRPSPSPPYTNLISNTNLFSPGEQKLLTEIPIKYKSVTTNTGPLGTVFLGMSNAPSSFVARFQYTNSDAYEEVTFTGMKSAKFRTKSGDGYDVDMSVPANAIMNFSQIKSGLVDGLFVSFYEGHCASWMRFAKGKAVGKWLMWGAGNKLLLEAEFREPYDFFKHAHHIRSK